MAMYRISAVCNKRNSANPESSNHAVESTTTGSGALPRDLIVVNIEYRTGSVVGMEDKEPTNVCRLETRRYHLARRSPSYSYLCIPRKWSKSETARKSRMAHPTSYHGIPAVLFFLS